MVAQTTAANESLTWSTLYSAIGNAYGTAGLMGNLYAESALIANNLQNTYNTKLGYTDKAYTDAVDTGAYTKFASDAAGYGLAQWTYSTRKKNLLAYAQKRGASVGNLAMQLDFLVDELKSDYYTTWQALRNATSVYAASTAVLTQYEKPANQSSSVKTKRAEYGQTYYDKYAKSTGTSSAATDKTIAGTYTVKTNGSRLNIRKTAGTSGTILGSVANGTTVTASGQYASVSGTRWLYVTAGNLAGYASGEYLQRA